MTIIWRSSGAPLRRLTYLLPAVGLLLTCCASCSVLEGVAAYQQIGKSMQTPAVAGRARLDMHQGLAVVHLYGTPQEMGHQYGTLLRTPLWAVHIYLTAFLPQQKKKTFLDYAAAHEPYLPQPIREEIAAMAEASGMPYQELVALNIVPRTTCSGLAVWSESSDSIAAGPSAQPGSAATQPAGALIMGRNADYFNMGLSDRGALVVVYHPQEGLAVASVTYLGMVGSFTGMNEKGVAFGNMLVFNAAGPPRDEQGLTIQLAQRLAAQQAQSAAEMGSLLLSDRHVIPMNVMVADSHEAVVLELGVAARAARHGEQGVLAVSNYFRTPGTRTREEACPRYDSLLQAGKQSGGAMTVAAMEKALYDVRVDKFNIQAVVFEPAARRMHVSVNRVPASAGPFVTLDLGELLTAPPAATEPASDGAPPTSRPSAAAVGATALPGSIKSPQSASSPARL